MGRQNALAQNAARKPRRESDRLKVIRGRGPEGLPLLDRLVHERIRLGLLSALAAGDASGLKFNELKALLKTTDGNLSVHARKLEEAGYVACIKSFDGRVPKTVYRLAAPGRRALERYLDHLEALLRAAGRARPR